MKKKLVSLCHSNMRLRKILMVMKLITLLSIVFILQVNASVYSQTTMLNVDVRKKPIREVLTSLEKSTDFRFFFNEDFIDVDLLVSLDIKNKNVDGVLKQMFEKTEIDYKLLDNNIIVLTKRQEKQTQTITGTVKDAETGEALPGVNVFVEGTTTGSISDTQGNYSIEVPDQEAVLVFSFVGYLSEKIVVSAQSTIDVLLMPDIQRLAEVVVVGYGTVKKSDVTGSVVNIGSEDLNSQPVSNVYEAMQGKVAGVDITSSIRPGTLGSINIRGVRSLTASNSPLYVVDGVPIIEEALTDEEKEDGFQKSSGIETLNPQDIESIDILKDASATAIYGSRGANGVVLITTKRGKEGKIALNYSGTVTSESLVWRSKYMNAEEFIDFIRWGSYNRDPGAFTRGDQPSLENDGLIELFTADPTAWNNIQRGWSGGSWNPAALETFDWMGEVIQPNITQEHTLSASGGNEIVRSYGSIGYLNNQGTVRGQGYKRYSLKSSIDLIPTDWFKIGLTINGALTDQSYGQADIGGSMGAAHDLIGSAAKVYPYALPYDAGGNLIAFPGGQSRVANIINEWDYTINNRHTMRILASLFAEVNLTKALKYKINFGQDYRDFDNGVYNDGLSVTRGGSSYASYSGNKNFSWTLDNLLYYNKSVGNHSIGLTLLQTATKYTYTSFSMAGEGVDLPSMKWYALGSLSSLSDYETNLRESQLESFMARANYNFNEKYIVTVSGRWDGASQLAEGNKWAFFPSAAIGWRMDQEDFLKQVSWISQMKWRLGYGVTGNASVDLYTTKGGVESLMSPFGGSVEAGYVITSDLSNPELSWERTKQLNMGLDYGIFKHRVHGTIDIYKSRTEDLLMWMSLPSTTGYNRTLANVGITRNIGMDISVHSVNIKKDNITWSSRVSASWQKDEIVSLMNGKEDMDADSWIIGESIEIAYTYERSELWQDTPEDQAEMELFNANGHNFEPGMIKVKDQNGDYQITANDDRVVIGNLRPHWILGLGNEIKYKNWELDIFITGRLQYISSVSEALTGMYGDQRALDYWTPLNTDAEYQKPFRDEAGGDTYSNTYYKDDSYLKIRNISLGYSFDKNFLSNLRISTLKIYAQARNPGMLWSANKFKDAEFNTLYYNRGFVFGVNVGF